MTRNDSVRGKLFLGLGSFFTAMFLVGGGVVTSTNGAYWTSVFAFSFVAALLVLGPMIYRRTVIEGVSQQPSALLPRRFHFVAFAIMMISSAAWQAFFQSATFTTSIAMHSFLVVMGVCSSFFVPLGLGMMHRVPVVSSESSS